MIVNGSECSVSFECVADYSTEKKSGDQGIDACWSHLPILNERRTLKTNIRLLLIYVNTNKKNSQEERKIAAIRRESQKKAQSPDDLKLKYRRKSVLLIVIFPIQSINSGIIVQDFFAIIPLEHKLL